MQCKHELAESRHKVPWHCMADFGPFTNLFLRNCKHHSIHWPSNSPTEIGSGETLTGNVSMSSKTFGWSARNWRSESKVWRFSSSVNSTVMVLSLSYRLHSPLSFHTIPCNSFLYHLCHPLKPLAIDCTVTWKSCQRHYGWYIIHFSHTIRNAFLVTFSDYGRSNSCINDSSSAPTKAQFEIIVSSNSHLLLVELINKLFETDKMNVQHRFQIQGIYFLKWRIVIFCHHVHQQ